MNSREIFINSGCLLQSINSASHPTQIKTMNIRRVCSKYFSTVNPSLNSE